MSNIIPIVSFGLTGEQCLKLVTPNNKLYIVGSSNGDDVRPATVEDVPYIWI